MLDGIGWIANIGFILGSIFISFKNKNGFIFNIFGNLLYLYVGIYQELYSLSFISLFLALISLFGYFKWTKR